MTRERPPLSGGEAPAPSAGAALAGQILTALSADLKTLRGEMDALRAQVQGGLGQADALLTGVHQDVANLILRAEALHRYLAERDPDFVRTMEAEMHAVVAAWQAAAPTPKEDMTDDSGRASHVPTNAE